MLDWEAGITTPEPVYERQYTWILYLNITLYNTDRWSTPSTVLACDHTDPIKVIASITEYSGIVV